MRAGRAAYASRRVPSAHPEALTPQHLKKPTKQRPWTSRLGRAVGGEAAPVDEIGRSSRSSEPRAPCSAAARVNSSRRCSWTRSMNCAVAASGTSWIPPSTPAVPRAMMRDEAEQLATGIGDVGGRLTGREDHAVRREVAQLELLHGEVAVAEQKTGEHRVVRANHAVAGEVDGPRRPPVPRRPCGPCSPGDSALHCARAGRPRRSTSPSAAGRPGPAASRTFPEAGPGGVAARSPRRKPTGSGTPARPPGPTTGRSAGRRRARRPAPGPSAGPAGRPGSGAGWPPVPARAGRGRPRTGVRHGAPWYGARNRAGRAPGAPSPEGQR